MNAILAVACLAALSMAGFCMAGLLFIGKLAPIRASGRVAQ